MERTELRVPRLGESVNNVQLTKYIKLLGDFVEKDEAIAEITTDKVDSELIATASGRLMELPFDEGAEVPVGAVYAVLGNGHGRTSPFYSPAVRKLASANNLSVTELGKIHGTGAGGRVSKNDVISHLAAEKVVLASTPSSSTISISGNQDIIEMDKMRKIISRRMKESVQRAPHVTAFIEADVTDLVRWREENKDAFLEKYQEKLTLTHMFVKVLVRALQDFPMINVSVDDTETKIIVHRHINIGIATELPDGNLIVPVIKEATRFNLEGLAVQINQLVDKARRGRLAPDEARGSTFTISNVGTFGSLMGTPIINQPEVAILATGAIKKKPAVLETSTGDVFAVRKFIFLSLSFDHRVVDGSLGGVFLKRIADYLEQWDMNTKI